MTAQDDALAQMVARVEEERPIIDALVRDGMPPIMAHIVAGDIMSAKRATEMVNDGMPAERAQVYVGSYARWDWVLTMIAEGKITEQWMVENVCHLWQGSDPDDTNPEYLTLWKALKRRNGGLLRDGRPLPKARDSAGIKVYRGGPPPGVYDGFAWTTDPKIAMKFAIGVRVPQPGGVVISGRVHPRDVIAFITGRRESECIIDPAKVRWVEVIKTPAQVAAHWIKVRGPQ